MYLLKTVLSLLIYIGQVHYQEAFVCLLEEAFGRRNAIIKVMITTNNYHE